DRRRLSRLSQRPAGPLPHGRWPAVGALARSSRRAVPPGRRRAYPARPGSGGGASEAGDGARGRRLMRDLSQHIELLSLNTATVRKQAPLDQIIEAAVARGISMIDPWRDQVQATGLDKVARQLRDAGVH